MAFVDAIELASEAGAADAIGALAGDLAKVAPSIEGTSAGSTASLRTAAISPETSKAFGPTIPAFFEPFSNKVLNVFLIGGMIIGGVFLSERGWGGFGILVLMLGVFAGIYWYEHRTK